MLENYFWLSLKRNENVVFARRSLILSGEEKSLGDARGGGEKALGESISIIARNLW